MEEKIELPVKTVTGLVFLLGAAKALIEDSKREGNEVLVDHWISTADQFCTDLCCHMKHARR